MFAAKATAVNSNPVTRAHIQRQLIKQGVLPPDHGTSCWVQSKREAKKRQMWERFAFYVARVEKAKQRDADVHTMAYILRWVSITHNVSEKEIKGRDRARNVVLARKAFCYWAHRLVVIRGSDMPVSYPQIGVFLDGRDHTTVLHACRTYRRDRKRWRKK